MNKSEIIEIIKSEINKFINNSLDNEIKKIIQKSNSHSRDELIKTIKNSLEAVYKTLWQKRDFWKTDIK
jgi:hypothetical protein